jgi:hypothetical protein
MITENFIRAEIEALEVWIGRKLDTRFVPKWIEECETMDRSSFLKAAHSFRNSEYFPNFRDFKAAYSRAVGVETNKHTHPGCDWCDGGFLSYVKEGYEYEGRCSICNIQNAKYSKMPLINPASPLITLHPSHKISKDFNEKMRADGKDPDDTVMVSTKKLTNSVKPFRGQPDPVQEKIRQDSISRDYQRDEAPF